MELYQLYNPITATPFQQNEEYQEFEPCDALKPYIRCFWGTKEPIIKKASDTSTNVTFNGGFAIQQNFANLTTVSSDSVVVKSNNMELYFEVEDFDMFLSHLEQYPHIEFVHSPKKHAWQQRVVRIYDPDCHMIEIGESMESIAKRYLAEGLSVEKVAEIIQHPIGFVEKCNSEK